MLTHEQREVLSVEEIEDYEDSKNDAHINVGSTVRGLTRSLADARIQRDAAIMAAKLYRDFDRDGANQNDEWARWNEADCLLRIAKGETQ